MSSLAQEESRSISENCTWGLRKRFQDGKVSVPFGRFLGYDRGEDGNLVINEDALLQKVYTPNFLTKKKIKNEGQVPQYYVENNHPAIIEPDVFDSAQKLMELRCRSKNRNSCMHPFSGKIKCGDCGSWYGSKVWHSNDKYRRVVWQCNHKFDGDCKCTTPHVTEDEIKEGFVKAMNILTADKAPLSLE